MESRKSVIDCMPNVIAGCLAHAPDAFDPGLINAAIPMQANDICRDLTSGKEMIEIVRNCEDSMSLGIGAMLAKMCSMGMIREFDHAAGKLNGIFGSESSKNIQLNRRAVIVALQTLGIVPSEKILRMVKPAGTFPTLEEISHVIKFHTGITFDQVRSASQVREIVNARYLVIWELRTVCGLSLTDIGRRLGSRDHNTIINGLRRLLKSRLDMEMRNMIDKICGQSDDCVPLGDLDRADVGLSGRIGR